MATNPKIQRLYVHEVTLTKNLQRAVADTTAVHKDYNPITQPKGEIAKVLFNHLLNKETERNPLNISIDANGNVVPASANNYGMDEPIQESNTRKDMKQNKKTINEAQLRTIVKEAVKSVLNESDSSYAMFPYQSDIFRYAYNHQTIRPKLDEVYRLVDDIGSIAAAEGRENYARFYKKLKTDLGQVYRLWDFLDND